MSTTVKAEVQPDALERLANCRPLIAIAELIWNGFDADAKKMSVTIERNNLDGISAIVVSDDGHGISRDEALEVFKNFGGSWKKEKQRSRTEGRMLHGQDGQGRYRAFGIGHRVIWESTYRDANGDLKRITIAGSRQQLTDFDISDAEAVDGVDTGTAVRITDPLKEFRAFDEPAVVAEQLAVRFASSLREYPEVAITFDGEPVDPSRFEHVSASYDLAEVELEDGSKHAASLVVIEWTIPVERALYFCDENGFAFERQSPGIQAPDFVFTAYLQSTAVRVLEDRAAFAWGEDHPDLAKLSEIAKAGMRAHFTARRAEQAEDLIKEWKAEDVYPYEGEPANPVERAERQVFDVVAKNVRDYLPTFDATDAKGKKFSLRLLRRAIETSPSDVQRIIQEVLELPEDKATDLAGLLRRTSLSAIIEASKVVADRLDFLRGLEMLIYHPESKKQLLERAQLQKILEGETWIFGEEFALTVADRSLNEVLVKHLDVLGRGDEADHVDDVVLPDGGRGIVDLMLSRQIPQPQDERAEHIVVELKRPSQKVTAKVLRQTEDYARAVANDERFAGTDTKWHFWAISNELDDGAKDLVSQSDRPFGLLYQKENPRIEVWSMPWALIIRRCIGRLRFYQERLEYNATDENALAYLHGLHDKYLPEALARGPEVPPEPEPGQAEGRD